MIRFYVGGLIEISHSPLGYFDLQLLGTLDSNEIISYLDLSGNLIDEHLISKIDKIMSQSQTRARLPQIMQIDISLILGISFL